MDKLLIRERINFKPQIKKILLAKADLRKDFYRTK